MASSPFEALDAEIESFFSLLKELDSRHFSLVTQFKGWTVSDVVLHLYAGDKMAMSSIASPAEYAALRADVQRARASGLTMIEESRQRFGELDGKALVAMWHAQARQLGTAIKQINPADRIAWSGPPMRPETFASARQMEIWAHGHAIYDLLGLARREDDRLEHIALLGVKTFAWTFQNRQLEPPTRPGVELTLPSGRLLDFESPQSSERITGEAIAFCQVVTQVRNVQDTELKVDGPGADAWMRLAQCFAGPPADPPAPGTRKRIGDNP